ncbi:MAG: hypothetical protein OXI58_10155 [Gemmatimonadota bacterium]|nr:hypothetical protein [Gemmatimonadota bacterium]
MNRKSAILLGEPYNSIFCATLAASLIYGGDRAYRRNGVAVRPWFAI